MDPDYQLLDKISDLGQRNQRLEKGIQRLIDLPISRVEIYKSELKNLLKETE